MDKIIITSNDPNNPVVEINVTAQKGSPAVIPIRVDETGSDHVTIAWGLLSSRQLTRIYIDSEPPNGSGMLTNPLLVGTISDSSTDTYTISDISPMSHVFIQLEVDTTGGDTVYGSTYAITQGGEDQPLDSSVRMVGMVSPDTIAITMANFDVTSWSQFDGDTYDGGATTLNPDNGPIYADISGWTVVDSTGATYTITSIGRDSVPVRSPYFTIADTTSNYSANDHRLDVDHTIYLKLNSSIGSSNILNITGPLGVNFKFVFNDKYTVSNSIQVNQVGYCPRATKRYAYVSNWLGTLGAMSLSGFPTECNVLKETGLNRPAIISNLPITYRAGLSDPKTQSYVNEIDLISVPTEEGTNYRIHIPGVGVSWPTQVSESSVFKTFYTVMRYFTMNRWGQELHESWTDWSHRPTDHTGNMWKGDGSDSTTQIPTFFLSTTAKNEAIPYIAGGHHDAGDFDIRPTHFPVAQCFLDLFETYGETKFVDEQLNIPESGNGIPDLLSEALYSIKMWEDLQDSSSGGIPKGMESYRHPLGIYWGDEDTLPYWTFNQDPYHTLRCAGLFAHASHLLQSYDASHASTLQTKAISAFNYAINQGINTTTSSDGGLLYACNQLYRLTNDSTYSTIIENMWNYNNKWGGGFMDHNSCQALVNSDYKSTGLSLKAYLSIYYYDVSGIDPSRITYAQQRIDAVCAQDETNLLNAHGFRHGMPSGYPSNWGQATMNGRWCRSFLTRINFSNMTSGAALSDSRKQDFLDYMSLNSDWVLGCNPLGRSWISGLGSRPIRESLWADSLMFDKYTDRGPIPGCIVYGPVDGVPGSSYYWWARNACEPPLPNRPEWRRFVDIRSFVGCSEFTVDVQAGHVIALGALLKDGGIVPPATWAAGGSEQRNYLPPTDPSGIIS